MCRWEAQGKASQVRVQKSPPLFQVLPVLHSGGDRLAARLVRSGIRACRLAESRAPCRASTGSPNTVKRSGANPWRHTQKESQRPHREPHLAMTSCPILMFTTSHRLGHPLHSKLEAE